MISILAPSRDRPSGLYGMIESARATARTPIEVVCRIDDDEPQAAAYRAMQLAGMIDKLLVGPRIVMSDMWNVCMRAASGDIFMLASDDVVMRTPGWTGMVEMAFASSADKLLLVHGDDLGPDGKWFPTFPIIHRRWAETTGRFTAPYFSCDYADTWLWEVAKQIGRVRFFPYVTEHLHWVYRKAAVDQTTREIRARGRRDNPKALFERTRPERNAEAEKLRALLLRPKWSLLILTQPSRAALLARLTACLLPQLLRAQGVDLVIAFFNSRLSLGAQRQKMTEEAQGEYVSIVDDDDLVAPDFIQRILPLLDGVDQVGFRLQEYKDGVPLKPTFISLRYNGWHDDAEAEYRDIMHLCPLKRELSLEVRREGPPGEDARWACALSKLGVVKTEHFLDAVMYMYYLKTGKADSPGTIGAPPWEACKQPQPEPAPAKSGRFEGACLTCPVCGSTCVVPSNGQVICNQCQHQGVAA